MVPASLGLSSPQVPSQMLNLGFCYCKTIDDLMAQDERVSFLLKLKAAIGARVHDQVQILIWRLERSYAQSPNSSNSAKFC